MSQFSQYPLQIQNKLKQVPLIDGDAYARMHPTFLQPMHTMIDCEAFMRDLVMYDDNFLPWGNNRPELADDRLGLPLVNLDGLISDDDIAIGPLDQYNKTHPDSLMLESDFRKPTSVLEIKSLSPIAALQPHLQRSAILKWRKGASFLPHVDTIIPSPNIRLWGTTDPSRVRLRYKQNDEWVTCDDVEAGRMYLIDTSIIHDATSMSDDWAYQFFVCLSPHGKSLIEELLC